MEGHDRKGDTLAARCVRCVRSLLRAARERPGDGAAQARAARVYAGLHAVPCALVAVLLRDADAAQLLRVERATHAQGARIATEAHWRALCARDHGAAHKTAPDATWRMTYEAHRRAAALAAEEERLADALEELRDDRRAAARDPAAPPCARIVRVICRPAPAGSSSSLSYSSGSKRQRRRFQDPEAQVSSTTATSSTSTSEGFTVVRCASGAILTLPNARAP